MKIFLKIAYQILKIYWFIFRPVTCGVRLLLIRDESVVLVRHSYQDAWFLPGGDIKRSETLEQAIRREAMEECGASLTCLHLLGAYTQFDNYRITPLQGAVAGSRTMRAATCRIVGSGKLPRLILT